MNKFSNPSINLNEKKFKALSNSSNGEVGSGTIFHYRQDNDIVWATYQGGSIKFGTLSGSIDKDQLQFNYQHQNISGEFMTGKCHSIMQIVNHKIRSCLDIIKSHNIIESDIA